MFVAELRGYVQTADGIDSISPVGRISRHEDRNNDGVFEHHTAFVDKLLFPRFVMPLGADTDPDDGNQRRRGLEVHRYERRRRRRQEGAVHRPTSAARARGGQQASLFWGMDNWLYSTVNAFRLRWTPNGLLKEPTGPNSAQWGVTQDNDGKPWFQGGASGMPGYFQFPVHYGAFVPPDQFEPDLNVMWGAPILVGDIQAGLPGTRMPDGSLIHGTAAAGNEIYRGDRLPKDLVGDYLYGEIVARIVRRLRPVKTEGLTQLQNAYPRSEFIRSLDPLFRPVDIATGPDGTLYIADLYRGIIEGAEWAKEGTYLRKKIEQYQLDKAIGRGRIFRLTYDGIARDRTQPRMLNETPAQLVAHLSHPNGWWRDTAQQLLVLKQDRSVVPALQQLVRKPANLLGRFHALWTLEGLGALTPAPAREVMKDPDARMRIQGIRASETLYKAGDRTLAADYRVPCQRYRHRRRHTGDADDQRAESPRRAPRRSSRRWTAHKARGVQFVADRILTSGQRRARRRTRRSGADARAADRHRSRQRHLHRGLLRVPWRRRARDAAARRVCGHADGAVARRLAPRQRPSRLRDQGHDARPDGPDGRQDLSAGHGGDGVEQGPVARRRRAPTCATRSATRRRG